MVALVAVSDAAAHIMLCRVVIAETAVLRPALSAQKENPARALLQAARAWILDFDIGRRADERRTMPRTAGSSASDDGHRRSPSGIAACARERMSRARAYHRCSENPTFANGALDRKRQRIAETASYDPRATRGATAPPVALHVLVQMTRWRSLSRRRGAH
jgi:hypothetical protein